MLYRSPAWHHFCTFYYISFKSPATFVAVVNYHHLIWDEFFHRMDEERKMV
jgi:hypothetical protein